MTADELEAIVLGAQDPMQLARALAPLDEPQRAKLSTAAQKLYGQLEKNKANEAASDRLKTFLKRRKTKSWENWNSSQNRLASLALFGLCPLSVVKKRNLFVGHDLGPVIERILRDRRPEWLDDWIAHELDQEWSKIAFEVLRGWIRDGLCRKPTADGYYRQFAGHLMRTGFYHRGEKVPPISAQLLADPALLDDVEGLFRVEHNGFNTNGWLTKGAAPDYESWTDALVKLADQGHLDRAELLALALQGLRLDLKQNQLAGFHGFYKRMAPTAEEQLRHQGDYIALLCQPVGHVVKFAIEMLAAVEKAGALDTGPVVSEIQPVLASGGKGNAVAALKLLKRIVARQKGADPATLAAVGEALRHVEPDVQSQALDLLEAFADKLGETGRDALAGAEAFVSASNRARLAALLDRASGQPVADAPAAVAAPIRAEEPANDPAGEALAYAPISEDITEQRVLFAEDALAPIESVEALIDAAFHAVEVVDSPDEAERIVDAIARLVGDRPADFAARVAPLLHRLGQGRVGNNGLAAGAGVASALDDLLRTWLTGRLHRSRRGRFSYNEPVEAFVPMIGHLEALARRVAAGTARQILSAPTHKGGWIDPRVWVERLHDSDATLPDLSLSLLRLAPDHRAVALARAEGLEPGLRRLARFALGGDEAPAEADRKVYAAWISAARCRAPLRDWSAEFAPLRLDDIWPDSLVPARYTWRAWQEAHQNRNMSWSTAELEIEVEVGGAPAPKDRPVRFLAQLVPSALGRIETDWRALPSAALTRRFDAQRRWSSDLNTPWVAQWLAHLWPQNPAAACMTGVAKLHERIDENSSGWEPRHGFLRVLFQRGRPWREAGHLLLCLGLAGKDADAKGLAVDALIEGIDGRLFDPARFAAVLGGLAAGGWLKFNRLADGLMQAMAVSDLHAAVVREAIENSLPSLDLQQKNAFRLLEVLVEAQAATARPLGEATQAALRRVAGGGKSAKLAKRLLAA